MGCLGRVTCTLHLISTHGHPGKKYMYHYKRGDTKGQLIWERKMEEIEDSKKGISKLSDL
jgi:hypothetical protein